MHAGIHLRSRVKARLHRNCEPETERWRQQGHQSSACRQTPPYPSCRHLAEKLHLLSAPADVSVPSTAACNVTHNYIGLQVVPKTPGGAKGAKGDPGIQGPPGIGCGSAAIPGSTEQPGSGGNNCSQVKGDKGEPGQDADQTAEITELQLQNVNQSERISDLEQESQNHASTISALESQNANYSATLSELQLQNGGQSAKLLDLEQKNLNQSERISELEQQSENQVLRISALESQNSELVVQLANYSARLSALEKTPKTRCDDRAGIFIANTCYFPLEERYNFDDAQTACEERGAILAPVTTLELYNALEPFLRGFAVAEGLTAIELRLGLIYDPSTGGQEVTTLDGTTVTWDEWLPAWPSPTATYTTVLWFVRANPDDGNQGFFQQRPSQTGRPLCAL